MAVAYDAFAVDAGLDTGTPSWTHTPTGTPRGIVVFVFENSTTDGVTGITYGGIAMTECAGSPFIGPTGGEWQIIHAFFLGSSIPTGAQTVTVSVSAATAKLGSSISMTAARDTEVASTDGDGSATGPSATANLSTPASVETCCVAAGFSGQASPTAMTWDASMTEIAGVDHGVYSDEWARKTTNPSGGDYSVVLTVGADEVNMFAVAVRESASVGGDTGGGVLATNVHYYAGQ